MATYTKRGSKVQARVRRKGFPDLTKTFDNIADARRWSRHEERRIALGDALPASERSASPMPTLHTALDRYRREVSAHKKGARQELSIILHLQAQTFALSPMDKVGPATVAAYRDQRISSGSSPSTVGRSLSLVSHLYTVAQKEWELEVENPVSRIRKPRPSPARDRRLLEGEAERLLPAVPEDVRPVVLLLLFTAMRRGEALALQWSDVDVARRVVVLRDTKNGDSRRVPLSLQAVDLLNTLPRTHKLVFPCRTPDRVSKGFASACAAVGIAGLRLHDLRREAASRLFEKGLTVPEVAAITGHRTWSMLKRYTAITAEHLLQKID